MKAYHNDPKIKTDILAQLAAHREADELVKGQYWEDGKGCAVGCTLHSGNHMEYESRFGIPVMLARLEDTIFEGLPNGNAQAWPERFMAAFEPGCDYSLIGWKFLHWLLTDEAVNPGINHPDVRDAVKQCAVVVGGLANGKSVDRRAAESARSAARRAAESAESAWSAWSAWSAERAGSAAERAAWRAAERAGSAARRAAESAESAAERAAWSAAGSAAYVLMSDKLIELIEQERVTKGDEA